ncbi:MAG: hypothetical protein KIS66_16540 [Fimbriimonadaceae bacterium]|nr:hypothetical protein [Fimbriimonadaceae bacterium]
MADATTDFPTPQAEPDTRDAKGFPTLATIMIVALGAISLYIGKVADEILAGQWPTEFFVIYIVLAVMTMLSPSVVGFRKWQLLLAVAFIGGMIVIQRTPYTPRKLFAQVVRSIPVGTPRADAERALSPYVRSEGTNDPVEYRWNTEDPRYNKDVGRVWFAADGRVVRTEFWPGHEIREEFDAREEAALEAAEKKKGG